jgi:hypothetical protein
MRLIEPLRITVIVAAFAAGPALAQTPPAHPAPPAAAAAPAAQAWQRFAEAEEVQLRDVAAIVRVTPENRTDVALAIANGGPLRDPEVRVRGERLVVDGKLRRQIRSCRVRGQDFEVTTGANGRLRGADLLVIDLRVPQSAVVSAGGAVRLHMAPSQSAQVRLDGCGEADIERVADAAEISVAGGPDVRLYEAGTATVSVAGSGDVVVGAGATG